jgi:Tfp pilus assembly protein PilF
VFVCGGAFGVYAKRGTDQKRLYRAWRQIRQGQQSRRSDHRIPDAVQRDPKFAEAYQELATAYISRGDGPNALRNSIIAADLLPDSIDAQIQAGNLLLIAGKFDDAKARAGKALAKAPQNARRWQV